MVSYSIVGIAYSATDDLASDASIVRDRSRQTSLSVFIAGEHAGEL